MTERKTLTERINETGVTVVDWSSHGFKADDSGWEYQDYTFELGYSDDESRRMTTPFKTGTGIYDVPDVRMVLEALLSDAATYENSDGFEDWADDCGYDPDSRKAERIYLSVKEQTERLRVFLGDDYESFLWDTDTDDDVNAEAENQ